MKLRLGSVGSSRRDVFRILVVDDSPNDVFVLQEALKNLAQPCHVDWVKDGSAALDFLYRRGIYTKSARPHLVLLDVNMPRVSGLEALKVIKDDPELAVIPAIMLSSSTAPSDVLQSYRAHANGYVQKPISLADSARLIHAIEEFWMKTAVLPVLDGKASPSFFSKLTDGDGVGQPISNGPKIACAMVEAKSQAMRGDAAAETQETSVSGRSACQEHRRLLDEFGAAVHELLKLHEDQFRAVIQGDNDSSRFDLLIHMANEKKQLAKYAYLRHMESHGCANFDALNQTRT